MSRMIKAFFAFVVVVFVLGIAYNVFVFTDCMNAGNRAYQCNAAMQNPNYIAVEDIGNGD